MQPIVLIIESQKGLGSILKQIAVDKGALVDMLISLNDLEKNTIPVLIERRYYNLVIINYQMAVEHEAFDIIAYVQQQRIPYVLIYTSDLRASTAYEMYAFWSFVITPNVKDIPELLRTELLEEFTLPPRGDLKFTL